MTSEFNARYDIVRPKKVIGTQRPPNRRDLTDRELTQRNLSDLPDPEPHIALRRAALKLKTATLMSQQQIIQDMQPESAMRASLTVLADAHNDPVSDPDWETVKSSSPEMDEQVENYIEDSFIAKVRGAKVGKVKDARDAKRTRTDMQAFAKKVRTVRERSTKHRAPKRAVSPPLASPSRAAAEADAADAARAVAAAADAADAAREAAPASTPTPALPPMQPGTTRELTVAQAALALTNSQMGTNVTTEDLKPVMEIEDDEETYTWGTSKTETREMRVAEAALALTNSQMGTNVTMEDLKTVTEIEDDEETYTWSVSKTETREMTVAEAALVLTNAQAGTNVTMEDLRTARLMVDLWDNEDVYEWTVGNFE